MALSSSASRPEGRPLTEAQRLQQGKREAQSKATRRFYQNKGRKLQIYYPETGQAIETETPSNPDDPVAALSSHVALMKILEARSYQIDYKADYDSNGKPIPPDKQETTKIIISVDNDGNITPAITHAYYLGQDKKNLLAYRAIMNTYAVNGVTELVLDFPGADGKHGNMVKMINLDRVLKILEMAKQEGIIISIGPTLQKRLDMLDPMKPKDAIMRKKINDALSALQEAQASNAALQTEVAKETYTYNSNELNKSTVALKAAQEAFSTAPPAEVDAKLNAIKVAQANLAAIMTGINDDTKDISDQKILSGYERDVRRANETTQEVRAVMATAHDTAASPADKATFKEVLDLLDKQLTQNRVVVERVNVEKFEPAQRLKSKSDRLKENLDAVKKAAADLRGATTDGTRAAKLADLQRALDALSPTMGQMKGEAFKVGPQANTKEQLMQYQAALRAAEPAVTEARTAIEAALATQPTLDVTAARAAQQKAVNDGAAAMETLDHAIVTPADRQKAHFDAIKQQVDRLSGAAKLEAINNELDSVNNRLADLDGQLERIKERAATEADRDPFDVDATRQMMEDTEHETNAIKQEQEALQASARQWQQAHEQEAGRPVQLDSDGSKLVVFDFDHTLTNIHTHAVLMQGIDFLRDHPGLTYMDGSAVDLSHAEGQYKFLKNPPQAFKDHYQATHGTAYEGLALRNGLDLARLVEGIHELRQAGHEVGVASFNAFGQPNGGIISLFMREQYEQFVLANPDKNNYLTDLTNMKVESWLPARTDPDNKNRHVDRLEQQFAGKAFDGVVLIDDTERNCTVLEGRSERYAAVHAEATRDMPGVLTELRHKVSGEHKVQAQKDHYRDSQPALNAGFQQVTDNLSAVAAERDRAAARLPQPARRI